MEHATAGHTSLVAELDQVREDLERLSWEVVRLRAQNDQVKAAAAASN